MPEERLWCTACGTVTRDQTCDCNRWHNEMSREPHFVNYADAMQEAAREQAKEIANLRGALAFIHNSTEEGAIKHRDYDSLAIAVWSVAKEALDGKFVDDMHAAEVYDKLYPPSVVGGSPGSAEPK